MGSGTRVAVSPKCDVTGVFAQDLARIGRGISGCEISLATLHTKRSGLVQRLRERDTSAIRFTPIRRECDGSGVAVRRRARYGASPRVSTRTTPSRHP